jgi:prepilin-type N-terminal cleavage/methylation domain-containing protein
MMNLGKPPCNSRAFTLIEVIAAMAIIMLLVGGIYSIANGALQLSRNSAEARLADLRVSNLIELWRRQFENLPNQARLSTEPGTQSAWLKLDGTTGQLAWNPALTDADAMTFGIDDQQRLVLVQWRKSQRLATVVLLPEIENLRWDFYDATESRWLLGEWPHSGRRPQLAAVTFQLGRDPGPQRHVFHVAPANLNHGRPLL